MNQTETPKLKTSVTMQDVLAWKPCWIETMGLPAAKARTGELANGRTSITPLELLDLEGLSHEDILWLTLREDFFTRNQLYLLAADFAERVLPNFEKHYPNDSRPRDAIEARRRWVRGEITDDELKAAEAAARAAEAAAWAAAWDASWDAARAAARDASRDAACAAACAAEAAARAAARAAAWDASWDAACAAACAAEAAARAAARAAAWDASRAVQIEMIRAVLTENARQIEGETQC